MIKKNSKAFGPKENLETESNLNFIKSKRENLDPDENPKDYSELDSHKNPILHFYIRKFIRKLKKNHNLQSTILNDYHYNLIGDESVCYKEELKDISFSTKFNQIVAKFIISPYHPLRLLWSFFLGFYILFAFIYVPLEISFSFCDIFSHLFQIIGLVLFSLDIGVSFLTGHFFDGCLLLEPNKTWKHYVKTLFFSDVLGLIYFVYSLVFMNIFQEFPQFLIGKLIIFSKAQKFYWTLRILSNYFKIEYRYKGFIDLIKVMGFSLLIAHLIACSWHLITVLDPKNNWLIALHLNNDDWSDKYIYSIYWAITTMMTVGYGDIVPKNSQEALFATVVIVFGCVVYGYNLNCVGMVVQEIYKNENQFKSTLKVINNFMNRKHIDNNLQTRVQEYLYFIWNEQKINDNDEEIKVINNLSGSLKDELLLQAYGEIFRKFPLLVQNFSQKSLTKVISFIKEVKFTPGDEIYEEGKLENCSLFYINRGSVELFVNRSDKMTNNSIHILKAGEMFGQYSFFTGEPHKFSCKAREYTSIFAINHEEFQRIMKESAEDYESYYMIKDLILLKDDSQILNLSCFSCQSNDHTILHCPVLHYEPDKEKVIKKHEFYRDQDRNYIIRRQRKRFSFQMNLHSAKKFNEALTQEKKAIKSTQIRKNQNFNPFEKFNSSDIESLLTEDNEEMMNSCDFQNEEQKIEENEEEKEAKEMMKTHSIYRKTTNKSLEIKEEEENIMNKKLKTNEKLNKFITTKSSIHEKTIYMTEKDRTINQNFERVHEFSKYFPNSNCRKILKIYEIKRKRMEIINNLKEAPSICQKNYRNNSIFGIKIEEKAKKFEKYSFKASWYRDLLMKSFEKNHLISGRPSRRGRSPLKTLNVLNLSMIKKKGITFFNDDKFQQKNKPILSELVSLLLQQNRKIKENKQNNEKNNKKT